jgi:hypothetical protein
MNKLIFYNNQRINIPWEEKQTKKNKYNKEELNVKTIAQSRKIFIKKWVKETGLKCQNSILTTLLILISK